MAAPVVEYNLPQRQKDKKAKARSIIPSDWWHQIDVGAIDEKVPKGKCPKVTRRIGKSPPQYMDEEE